MCLSPVTIPNPNYGNKAVNSRLKDVKSAYIAVPCGYCSECIHTKQMSICQRLQMESISNYAFFATLTYDRKHLPKITTSQGFDISFADPKHFQDMVKRLRKSNAFGRPFRYVFSTERGKKGRPHFHAIFLIPKYEKDNFYTPLNLEKRLYKAVFDEWRINVSGSTKFPRWESLFTYAEIYKDGRLYRNFDLHYISPDVSSDGVSNVIFYVTKYMLKPDDRTVKQQQALRLNLSPQEYSSVWSIVRPRFKHSLYIGLNACKTPFGDLEIDPAIKKYLDECLAKSTDFPTYYNPVDGKPMPFSRYYKSIGIIYPVSMALNFSDASAFHPKDDKSLSFGSKDFKYRTDVEPQSSKFLDDILDEFE